MNKNYNIFLDDVRSPNNVTWVNLPLYEWIVVRNYDQFVNIIKQNGVPNFVSFDHDLADEHYRPSMYNPDGHYSNYYTDGTFKEKTGYDCAKYLIEYCIDNNLKLPNYLVHSMNPIGKYNIISILENFRNNYGK